MDWIQEKENLQHLIEEGVPYETIGKKYNCSGANIRKVSKKLGIELPKRRNINPKEHFNKDVSLKEKSRCIVCGKETAKTTSKYCSSKCLKQHEYESWISKWKAGEISGNNGSNLAKPLRRYLLTKFEYRCSCCGWGMENPYTHTFPLEIHHIDGNPYNNSERNLTVLCPNCHSLQPQAKGANRGNGRKERNTK